jgi:RHS repeat-associated protein
MKILSSVSLIARLIVVVFCLSSSAFAADESFIQTHAGNIKKGDTLTVIDDKYLFYSTEQWNKLKNVSVQNIVSFELRRDTNIYYNSRSFVCSLNITIQYYSKKDQEKPDEYKDIVLVVNSDSTRGGISKLIDKYVFGNAHKVKVIVNSIESPEWKDSLPPIFRIQNQIIVKRIYPFNESVKSPLSMNLLFPKFDYIGAGVFSFYGFSILANNSQVLVSWQEDQFTGNNPIGWDDDAEEYDLEWTYVDMYDESYNLFNQTNPPGSNELENLMRNNATRVTLSKVNSYRIPIIYPEGYLVARIRRASYNSDGVRLVSNDWSYGVSNEQWYLAIPGHEKQLTWQYTSNYAEGGKRKEVVSYFDGSLKNRQDVTVRREFDISSNSDPLGIENEFAIVGERVYDEYGRPVVSILPAPMLSPNLSFKGNFNVNTQNKAVSRTDVKLASTQNCNLYLEPLQASSGASQYYSPSNSFLGLESQSTTYFSKYIPDAKLYPFAVTQYTTDPTGRVRAQGGVGNTFQLSQGHGTNYYYGRPFPAELQRVFGMEAGLATYYSKNVVVDPNGQASVSYINSRGQTVATALAGNAPENVVSLPSNTNGAAITHLNQLLFNSTNFVRDPVSLTMTASSSYVVTSAMQNYTLHYEIDPSKIITTPAESDQFCTTCYYEISITVKDDCGTIAAEHSSVPFPGDLLACEDNTQKVSGNLVFEAQKIGEYFFTYTIKLSDKKINEQVERYITLNTDLHIIQTLFESELQLVDFFGCYTECSTCIEKLGTQQDFISKVKSILISLKAEKFPDYNLNIESEIISDIIGNKYVELYNECLSRQSNCTTSPCDEKLSILKLDVLPGGQYAPVFYNDATEEYTIQEASINVLAYYNNSAYPDVYGLSYTNEAGQSVFIRDLSFSNFVKAYLNHPEWADQFVKYHIEYCSYLWCKDAGYSNAQFNNEQSYKFDSRLRDKINTGEKAISAGLYNRSNYKAIVSQDPFFAPGGRGNSFKAQIEQDLDQLSDVFKMTLKNSSGVNLNARNIVQLIDWVLYCKPNSTTATGTDFINSWLSCTPSIDCRSTTIEWELFRNYYLRLKSKYFERVKAASNPGCVNCFIGSDGTSGDCSGSNGATEPPCQLNSVVVDFDEITNSDNTVGSERYVSYTYDMKVIKTGSPLNRDVKINYTRYLVRLSQSINPATGCRDLESTNPLSTYTILAAGTSSVTIGTETVNKRFDVATGCLLQSDEYFIYQITGMECLPVQNCTNCEVPVPSLCTTHPNRDAYENKNRIFGDYVNLDSYTDCSINDNTTPPSASEQASGFVLQATSTVSALKKSWRSILKTARDENFQFWDISDLQIENLINDLERIALKNIEHQSAAFIANSTTVNPSLIRPASTLPTGILSIDGYNSFMAAFEDQIDASIISQGFGPHLLPNPYPYNRTPISSNESSGLLSESLCAQINTIRDEFLLIQPGATNSQFHAWLKENSSDYYLTENQLVTILTKCAGNCSYLEAPLILPAAFSVSISTNTNLPFISCETYNSLKASFESLYTGIWPDTKLSRILLTNYFNQELGYSLSYADYVDFERKCSDNNAVVLFNRAISPIIPENPIQCETEILADLFNKVGQLYVEHLDRQRLLFRNRLIATCLSNNAGARLEGDLKEYHYTLYYYDQSGLLVKTVPPEGVEYLTADQLLQIEQLEANEVQNCSGSIAPSVSDPNIAFTEFSNYATSGDLKSMEMWFNSTDPQKTIRFVSPDNKYLFQSAIANSKVWVEVFSMDIVGGDIELTLTNQLTGVLPSSMGITDWSHVIIQSADGIATGLLEIYYNGIKLEADDANNNVGYPFEFEFEATSTIASLPGNVIDGLKHLRYYSRLVTPQEAMQNFTNLCRSPKGILENYATLNPNSPATHPLLFWAGITAPYCNTSIVANQTSNRGAIEITGLGSLPEILPGTQSNFTIEFWAKPTSTHEIDIESTSGYAGVLGQRFAISPSNIDDPVIAAMGVSVGTNGVSVYEHAFDYIPALLVWQGSLSTWTHIAVTYTNNRPKLYINGVFVKEGLQSTRTVVPSFPFKFSTYGYMNGAIDEIRVWDHARSASQISINYNNSIAPTESNGLVGYWPVSVSDGNDIIDVSCSKRHINYSNDYLTWISTSLPAITDYVYQELPEKPIIEPNHRLKTYYAYNSLNQVIQQATPDAGISKFWYDRLGRLSVSQNAKQKLDQNGAERFSYTRYDIQNRIIESGEMSVPSNEVGNVEENNIRTNTTFPDWVVARNKVELTITAYDQAPSWTPVSLLGTQTNLRKRVVATAVLEGGQNPSTNLITGSYFSYDIAGNVHRLVQENRAQGTAENSYVGNGSGLKTLDYEFDLISGKVNKVLYQDGKWDQYYHWYKYDAENRLTDVLTSRDNINFTESQWNKDARYQYYLHGPLARTVLGQQNVQGIDYAYTLQGWLKGVNSQHLIPGRDMGNDGHSEGLNTSIMPDVFGYSLGYFGDDYEAIGTGVGSFGSNYNHPGSISAGNTTGMELFNGNISNATYAIGLLNNGVTVGNTYQYDQLNRLLRVNRHTAITAGADWSNSSISAPFGENFTYDANGNILALSRNNNNGQVLDQLSYNYNRNELGKLVDNKLRDVQDPSRPQVTDNYSYDPIGNLTADEAEGLSSITWTVYGKIKQITKSDGSTITYSYDPSGNRVRKVVAQANGLNPVSTYYTRDAQGNTMAVYEQASNTYKWAEQHLYGSSRLGIFKPSFEVSSAQPLGSDAYSGINDPAANGIFGKKFFELSNHLGNVMVTVSDRTVQQLVGGNLVYRAEAISAQDYYAFGGLMPGRQVSVGDYRYGFNGKENDNEVKGTGNNVDFGARVYDPRIGRWLSVDPMSYERVGLSPYNSMSNNPTNRIDPDGQLDDWVQTGNQMLWDDRVTDQASATRIYGEGAIYRERGYSYTAKGGDKIQLWDQMLFTINGVLNRGVNSTPSNNYKPGSFDHYFHNNRGKFNTRIEGYRAWSGDPGVIEGESKLDRIFRVSAWSSMNARREWAAGGDMMYSVFRRSPGLGSRLVGFGNDGAITENLANLVAKRGWFDVVVHGTKDGLKFVQNGNLITAEQLYSQMLAEGYQQGTRIRLMSCYSGSLPEGAAYQLSKLANAPVMAPQSWLSITNGYGFMPAGKFLVGDNLWFKMFNAAK